MEGICNSRWQCSHSPAGRGRCCTHSCTCAPRNPFMCFCSFIEFLFLKQGLWWPKLALTLILRTQPFKGRDYKSVLDFTFDPIQKMDRQCVYFNIFITWIILYMPAEVRKQPPGAGSLLPPRVFRRIKLRSLGPLLTVSSTPPPCFYLKNTVLNKQNWKPWIGSPLLTRVGLPVVSTITQPLVWTDTEAQRAQAHVYQWLCTYTAIEELSDNAAAHEELGLRIHVAQSLNPCLAGTKPSLLFSAPLTLK